MFTFHRRTLALIGVTAATGLAVAGCGSGGDDNASSAHGGHSASTSSKTSSTSATANATDKAFVAQMIPHHQMAVQMAADTPKRGQHPEIKTLGGNITKSQEQEIAEMKAIAQKLGVTPAAMPMSGMSSMEHGGAHGGGSDSSMAADAKVLGLSMDDMGMSMDMAALKTAKPFDRAFIDEMIPHHQGAIRMARAELKNGKDPELKQIAVNIVAAQTKEIRQMNTWRKDWYGATSPAGGVPTA